MASPIPTPTPSPTPTASQLTPVAPAAMPVTFTGLRNGSYVTHLHSACDDRQAFHITVLEALVVRGGAGTIEVPSGYFGRGLCVIVYASPSLTTVLVTRRI